MRQHLPKVSIDLFAGERYAMHVTPARSGKRYCLRFVRGLSRRIRNPLKIAWIELAPGSAD
jgi:hypothetical protein